MKQAANSGFHNEKVRRGALIALLASLFAIGIWQANVFQSVEFMFFDLQARLLARSGDEKIKLILIDQSSLDWGKKENAWSWPWPREVYGAVLDFYRRSGARSIAFDMLFTEPSSYGVTDDTALAEAIAKTPGFVTGLLTTRQSGPITSWPENVTRPALRVEQLPEWIERHPNSMIEASEATFPITGLVTDSQSFGHVRGVIDDDYITRRVLPLQSFDGSALPMLGLAAYLAQYSNDKPQMRIDDDALCLGDYRLALDASGRTMLHYRKPQAKFGNRPYKAYSAGAIVQSALQLQAGLQPQIDPAELKDSYVFFGVSAPGLYDLKPTPFSKAWPGVMSHATILDNLLAGDSLTAILPIIVCLLSILLATVGSLAATFTQSATRIFLWHLLVLPAPILASGYSYTLGYWLSPIAPLSAGLLGLVGGVLVNYSIEGRQSRFIKRAFEQYLSPIVIDRLLQDPARLQLGGERREISILFSDLEGFSKIAERLDPQVLTNLLNEYLTDMTDIILEEGGTLDKYEGDAIIAFWNAPLDQEDHAVRVCRAALRCQRKLDSRREEFRRKTGTDLKMRVGINTGTAIVGNLGSLKRFDYSMIGDSVNLASRLEGANKRFGTYLMVSEYTWAAATKQSPVLRSRPMGSLRVVGRNQPVKVYELLGFANEVHHESVERMADVVEHCTKGEWAEAQLALELMPGTDPLAQTFRNKLQEISNNPETTWDGIWNLTEK